MRSWHRASAWILACFAAGCGGEGRQLSPAPGPYSDPGDPVWTPEPETCETPDPDALGVFPACSTGSAALGKWVVDDEGLPAYQYMLDQHAEPRAAYRTTEVGEDGEPLDRRDHWAAFGNHRVNAMYSNDGFVEVVTQDRGVEYLNKVDLSQHNYGGGFSYVRDEGAAWSTAYRFRPSGARTERRFGMGYGQGVVVYRGIRVERETVAPWGDEPAVVSDVVITNQSDLPRSLDHYEVWDIARRPIEINWAVSGDPLTTAPATARRLRDARNDLFDERVAWEPASGVLGLRRSLAAGQDAPPREAPSPIDYYPADPFLAVLVGDVHDVYVDQEAFFGDGGPLAPDAVVRGTSGGGVNAGQKGQPGSASGQPRMLVLASHLELAPGESKTLRFAFGYAPQAQPYHLPPTWRDPSWQARRDYASSLRDKLMLFSSERDPFLHRELAWHAYQLEASVGRRDYWDGLVVPQGSAYLYLHGADGAARDLGLFAIPLVYTDAELARAELLLYMGMQFAQDKRFSYAFQGHGMTDDAGIHTAPSDLALFFVWALSEYLGATGDLAFLDAPAPFYPRDALPGATVWDHLQGALRHQFDVVGTGEHGLIRIQTGDWSDGIVVAAPDRELAVSKGESVPNTQMAAAVLPRVAEVIEARDAALAKEIRDRVAGYRDALNAQWGGEFFYRAWYGDGKPVSADTINLESQVWALIGDTFEAPSRREALVANTATSLDEPSPTGATLVPGGEVWPAISGLLTWGYARSDPERAWAHLARNTMAAHANAFPWSWYGVWSGPDGMSSVFGEHPGEAWASVVTPMTDFPVQNNNQHAMPLLAALRVAGIDATARGVRVAPAVPSRSLSLRTALIDLTVRGATVSGRYRPFGDAPREIEVHAWTTERIASAKVNGKAVQVGPDDRVVTLVAAAGEETEFEVESVP